MSTVTYGALPHAPGPASPPLLPELPLVPLLLPELPLLLPELPLLPESFGVDPSGPPAEPLDDPLVDELEHAARAAEKKRRSARFIARA
jgi:hypothetical protein